MKVALIGYGKMGKEVEKVCRELGHEIKLIISKTGSFISLVHDLSSCDVAIEFTQPESAYENIKICIDYGLPIVSGTTGWMNKKKDLEKYCLEKNGSFLYASNFSIGVNMFFYINQKLAALCSHFPEYEVTIKEIHHTSKVDAPSGTAISLAEDIIREHEMYRSWASEKVTEDKNVIPVHSERIQDIPGTHEVMYESEIDKIEIKHISKSRKGFAYGAVMAAEWLQNRKGVYSMKEVLGLP